MGAETYVVYRGLFCCLCSGHILSFRQMAVDSKLVLPVKFGSFMESEIPSPQKTAVCFDWLYRRLGLALEF